MSITLDTQFKIKSIHEDGEDIVIEGLASTPGIDRIGDVILPSAWVKGIANYLKNPIILFNHDMGEAIGKAIEVTPVPEGLRIVATISSAAGRTYALIKQEIIKAFSIKILPTAAEFNETNEVLVISELELLEVSVVTIGMNADTLFNVRKSFHSDKDYNSFIKGFIAPKEEEQMPEEKVEYEVDLDAITSAVKKELKLEAEAIAKAAAKKDSDDKMIKDAIAKTVAELISTGEERLKADIEKALASEKADLGKLQEELKQKAVEFEAMQKSKMTFNDHGNMGRQPSKEDIAAAVLSAKVLKKSLCDTKAFKNAIEKLGPNYTAGMEEWESEYSTNIYNEIRLALRVEPVIKSMTVTQPATYIPVNPDAGVADWIDPVNYDNQPTTPPANDLTTGPNKNHVMTEQVLLTHKLATKSWLVMEDDEDSIINLTPLITEAMVRRMSKSSDIAILRGTGVGPADPILGLTTLAANAGANTVTASLSGTRITVQTLIDAREQLGIYGIDPGELVYFVSTEGYYSLLQDPKFQTIDLVGDRATLITGQIGSISGSPVVVSHSFDVAVIGNAAAVVVNPKYQIIGNQRNMVTDTWFDVEKQSRLFIATRRMGMLEQESGGVAVIDWVI